MAIGLKSRKDKRPWTAEYLTTTQLEELRRFDACTVSNAIETFGIRVRNEGFWGLVCAIDVSSLSTDGRLCSHRNDPHCRNADRREPDRLVELSPDCSRPRVIIAPDIDEEPGLGAFLREAHANILRALESVGAFLSSFVVTLIAAGSLNRFRTNHQVQAFLSGVVPAVVGMLAAAGVSLARSGLDSALSFGVATIAFLLMLRAKLNPVVIMVGCGALQFAVAHHLF